LALGGRLQDDRILFFGSLHLRRRRVDDDRKDAGIALHAFAHGLSVGQARENKIPPALAQRLFKVGWCSHGGGTITHAAQRGVDGHAGQCLGHFGFSVGVDENGRRLAHCRSLLITRPAAAYDELVAASQENVDGTNPRKEQHARYTE